MVQVALDFFHITSETSWYRIFWHFDKDITQTINITHSMKQSVFLRQNQVCKLEMVLSSFNKKVVGSCIWNKTWMWFQYIYLCKCNIDKLQSKVIIIFFYSNAINILNNLFFIFVKVFLNHWIGDECAHVTTTTNG